MKRTAIQPKYRHYRPKNLAVVRLDGRDVYLGPYDSPESHERYLRLLAERLASCRETAPRPPIERPNLTVHQLIDRYRSFAESYYVRDGKPTKELADRCLLQCHRRLRYKPENSWMRLIAILDATTVDRPRKIPLGRRQAVHGRQAVINVEPVVDVAKAAFTALPSRMTAVLTQPRLESCRGFGVCRSKFAHHDDN